jgi:hypothetical protein
MFLGRIGCYERESSGSGPVEGSCEHGNEPSGSIKCWEVLEQLATPQEGLSSIEYCGIFVFINIVT